MNSFTCEICGKEHEVFSLIDVNGKSKLCFLCNDVPVRSTDKSGHVITRGATQRLHYTGRELSGPFRKVWSKKTVKKKLGERQYQLPLMR